MAKASLAKVAKEWIEGKNGKSIALKKQKNKKLRKQKKKNVKDEKIKLSGKKSIRTIHLADEAYRLLMYHKADTGESMSSTIERLVLKNLKKK
ncbi:MAG: hypothetical protein J7L42_01880 [Elusimicrobia bacterium]|nr:hypothetical protein [Elusimicrobiota bacterium]